MIPTSSAFSSDPIQGFILVLAAQRRASSGRYLTTIFADLLQPGTEFQVINFASPRVVESLQGWAWEQVTGGRL
jgi:conjugal transfer ATP-binding protein TraC